MTGTCSYTLVHRMLTAQSHPAVDYGLWMMMMMRQCVVIMCNKCTVWWEVLRVGESMHM